MYTILKVFISLYHNMWHIQRQAVIHNQISNWHGMIINWTLAHNWHVNFHIRDNLRFIIYTVAYHLNGMEGVWPSFDIVVITIKYVAFKRSFELFRMEWTLLTWNIIDID